MLLLDSNGKGLLLTGTFNLQTNSNAICTYTLTSQNGALYNSAKGAVRTYSAIAYETYPGSPKPPAQVPLSSYAPSTLVRTFPVDGPIMGYPSDKVEIDFTIPASDVLAAGTYQDVLILTVNPGS